MQYDVAQIFWLTFFIPCHCQIEEIRLFSAFVETL